MLLVCFYAITDMFTNSVRTKYAMWPKVIYCPYNASVLAVATVNMMAGQPVSVNKYQEGMQQMQAVEQGDGDPEQSFADTGPGVTCSPTLTEPQTPMDADKASIYRHPLFPLLALLFEKCEQSTQSSECVTSASFDVDIENFVRSQEKDGKAFFSEDPELDNLMVKAIQVLRIHLLELEKVSDLCKDFCSRYIACLKTKMNSETLLSGEPGSPYSPVQTQLQLQLNQDLSFLSADDSSSKNKRGVLPKQATSIMRTWLFQHIGHPYPTEDEKKQIASQTNLTLLQVNNWFINARRRILQPMLDASSTETPKTKKKTPQNRPLQRFWPDSIASSGPQQQLTMADGTVVAVGMTVDGFQALSSDGATLAMQQVMMGNHSEEETDDSGDEDDLSAASMTRLGLDASFCECRSASALLVKFLRSMEHLFTGQPCSVIVDDIIIGGRGIAEHDLNLRKVLSCAREVNLRMNTDKCKFCLDQTHTQYAQIEKEFLAVMFACTKFRDYIYGKPTIVERDHQPLVTIMKKPIHTAPARLQRMLLKLQSYDRNLVYKKGKYMYLADTLSRANMQTPSSPAEDDAFEVMSVSYISTARLEELRKHTTEEDTLQALSAVIQQGWPVREYQLLPAVGPFFLYRDELSGGWHHNERPQSSHSPIAAQGVHQHCTQGTPRDHREPKVVKRDGPKYKSKRRKLVGWIDKKVKEGYQRKMEESIEREEMHNQGQ
ncbi:hypothetical protein P4O66_002465 [Electrophorus voltai]|uniref:Homeobox domain-containing protein n=1 Tax=Electrophorus voltai TaxID=2609070 RepID=A0AAD9DPS9_9TELE|nr:hypothetical protein P4O66_002465 [Electrophorus voltai]